MHPKDIHIHQIAGRFVAYLVELSLSSGKAVVTDDAGDGAVGGEASSEKSNAHVTGLLQPGGVGLAETGAALGLDLLDLLHLEMMRCDGGGGRSAGGRRSKGCKAKRVSYERWRNIT